MIEIQSKKKIHIGDKLLKNLHLSTFMWHM